MTTYDLIQLYKALTAYDLDSMYGETPTDGQVVSLLNWGQRVLSRRLYLWDPAVSFTAQANSYGPYLLDNSGAAPNNPAFGHRIVKIGIVRFNGISIYDWNMQPGNWALQQFERDQPDWQKAPSSIPSRIVTIPNGLLLWPPPLSVAGTHTISAQVLADDLTANYTFALSAPQTISEGAVYSNNLQQFTVLTGITAASSLVTTGTGAPSASGNLVAVSSPPGGLDPTPVAYASFTGPSETSSSPAIEVDFHEAIAQLAAIKGAHWAITEAEAFQRLGLMNADVEKLVNEIRRENIKAVHGNPLGWTATPAMRI
jgi:hypothetical protein